jgi:hypothetical protein
MPARSHERLSRKNKNAPALNWPKRQPVIA